MADRAISRYRVHHKGRNQYPGRPLQPHKSHQQQAVGGLIGWIWGGRGGENVGGNRGGFHWTNRNQSRGGPLLHHEAFINKNSWGVSRGMGGGQSKGGGAMGDV